jgi:hypothetical protein
VLAPVSFFEQLRGDASALRHHGRVNLMLHPRLDVVSHGAKAPYLGGGVPTVDLAPLPDAAQSPPWVNVKPRPLSRPAGCTMERA